MGELTERRHAVVQVNGEARTVDAHSVSGLLERLGYGNDRRGIAVAVNGRVVPRSTWAEEPIADGDEVEIVGAVQGG